MDQVTVPPQIGAGGVRRGAEVATKAAVQVPARALARAGAWGSARNRAERSARVAARGGGRAARRVAVGVAVLAAVVTLLAGNVQATTRLEEVEHLFPLHAGETLSIRGMNGSIAVAPWNGDGVRIMVTKEARAPAEFLAAWADRLVELEAERHEGGVRAGARGWGLLGFGNVSVHYRVLVPQAWEGRLELGTSNGDVTVERLRGEAEVRTANGDIAVAGYTGSLRLRTANGGIEVADSEVVLLAESSNGPLRVLRSVVREAGELRTSNQSIEFDAALSPGSSYELTTSNGPIRLTLHNPDVVLDLVTGNGSIDLRTDVAATRREGRRLIGQIGDGSSRLAARTSNGTITLDQGETLLSP